MAQKQSPRRIPFELGIIAIALIAILVSGYKIYNAKKGNSTPSTAHKTSDDSQYDISLTANWLEATSRGGSFTMKIPDGWKVDNYASGKEITDQIAAGSGLVYSQGQKAIVTDHDTPWQSGGQLYGLGAQFNTFVLNKKYEYKPGSGSTVQSSSKAVTRGGLSGTLTTVHYGATNSQLMDVPSNATYYVYTFPLPSEKTLIASFVKQDGQPDQTKYFEQAIRTIQIIK